jgi:homoserine kinase
MVKSVTVRAPCSTANLGPGFDVFGLALDAFYDEVTVTKKPKSFGIKIVSSDDIPLDPKKNTAGLVAAAIKKDFGIENGLEIKIKKNVPAGYGMGSSAASAAACAMCINSLFDIIEEPDLLDYAGIGEKASAGTVHYDNVAASLYGGFVVVNPFVTNIPFSRFAPPKNLSFVVAIPKIKVPKQKTKASRGVIPKNVKFSDACINLASAVSMVAHFADGDGEAAAMRLRDVIVEPARKKMIPGFDKVKKNALSAGAAACTISGAGPSVIAFVPGYGEVHEKEKVKIGKAMKKGFKSAKVDCDIVFCKPSKGARVTKVVK